MVLNCDIYGMRSAVSASPRCRSVNSGADIGFEIAGAVNVHRTWWCIVSGLGLAMMG